MIAEKTFDEIQEGDVAQFEVMVNDDLVQKFSNLSGDANPLHMDTSFAETTSLEGRVAHGMLGGALFSQLIGMHLPGKHALYLSQSLFFRKPLYLPTTVIVSGTVTQKIAAAKSLKIATTIRDAKTGNVLTDGAAMVQVLL